MGDIGETEPWGNGIDGLQNGFPAAEAIDSSAPVKKQILLNAFDMSSERSLISSMLLLTRCSDRPHVSRPVEGP